MKSQKSFPINTTLSVFILNHHEALIRALASAAVGDKDGKLRDLLAQNGIAINPQTGGPVPAPASEKTAVPAGEKPAVAAPTATEKQP